MAVAQFEMSFFSARPTLLSNRMTGQDEIPVS